MTGARANIVPNVRDITGTYRRQCDRCSFDGWLEIELEREAQTNLLVCPFCIDEPDPRRESGKFFDNTVNKIRQ